MYGMEQDAARLLADLRDEVKALRAECEELRLQNRELRGRAQAAELAVSKLAAANDALAELVTRARE